MNNDPHQHQVHTSNVPNDSATPVTPTAQGAGGRRRLLFGGMATAIAAIATACSSDDDDSTATSRAGSTQPTTASPPATGSTSGNSSPTASDSPPATGTADNTATTAAANQTDPTTGGDDGAADTNAPGDEGEGDEGDEGATSDGKNQEADVPVREGDVDGGRDPNNPTAKQLSAELADDLGTVTFAAGLEVLAIDTYRRASLAAVAGSLGPVPPAVAEFVVTVMGHHQATLDELNRVLLLSGQAAVNSPNAQLRPIVDDALADVNDVRGASRLALMLEEIAAATYLAAIPVLKSPEAIALAASVYPIDMQHASVLRFVLGEYPVPDVFGKVDKAATPS